MAPSVAAAGAAPPRLGALGKRGSVVLGKLIGRRGSAPTGGAAVGLGLGGARSRSRRNLEQVMLPDPTAEEEARDVALGLPKRVGGASEAPTDEAVRSLLWNAITRLRQAPNRPPPTNEAAAAAMAALDPSPENCRAAAASAAAAVSLASSAPSGTLARLSMSLGEAPPMASPPRLRGMSLADQNPRHSRSSPAVSPSGERPAVWPTADVQQRTMSIDSRRDSQVQSRRDSLVPLYEPSRGGSGGGGSGGTQRDELQQITCLAGRKFQGLSEQYLMFEICSLAESKFLRALGEADAAKWRLHNARHLTRVYPDAKRARSTNFNPFPMWDAGVQFVALNYQTNDVPMRANRALFAQNGRCGYLLKPLAPPGALTRDNTQNKVDFDLAEGSRSRAATAGDASSAADGRRRSGSGASSLGTTGNPEGAWLKIEVMSALHVPKPSEGRPRLDAHEWQNHAENLNTREVPPSGDKLPRICCVAEVHGGGATLSATPPPGAEREKDDRKTFGGGAAWMKSEAAAAASGETNVTRLVSRHIVGNGLQANFEHTVYVSAKEPELAVLLLTVHSVSQKKNFAEPVLGAALAYAALPLAAARLGVRAHELLAPDCGSPIAFASLLTATRRFVPYSTRSRFSRQLPSLFGDERRNRNRAPSQGSTNTRSATHSQADDGTRSAGASARGSRSRSRCQSAGAATMTHSGGLNSSPSSRNRPKPELRSAKSDGAPPRPAAAAPAALLPGGVREPAPPARRGSEAPPAPAPAAAPANRSPTSMKEVPRYVTRDLTSLSISVSGADRSGVSEFSAASEEPSHSPAAQRPRFSRLSQCSAQI